MVCWQRRWSIYVLLAESKERLQRAPFETALHHAGECHPPPALRTYRNVVWIFILKNNRASHLSSSGSAVVGATGDQGHILCWKVSRKYNIHKSKAVNTLHDQLRTNCWSSYCYLFRQPIWSDNNDLIWKCSKFEIWRDLFLRNKLTKIPFLCSKSRHIWPAWS